MANLATPWKPYGTDRSDAVNQENFTSRPVGMNRPPDTTVASANQPNKQRAFGGKYRMGNKRKAVG